MSSPVTVSILGKEYQVACPANEEDALIASAKMVDKNMEKIRNTGKIVGLDRIAVIAALNLAHELITIQNNQDGDLDEINKSILQMKDRVSDFLDETRQLEL
ncbi:MAG: cell division protein ZapA [Methylophagaceae bacterium]|jgi:cell division protein ZapA